MLCRLWGVFWNERRCFVLVTLCGESCGSRRCVKYGRQKEWRCRREEGIYILKFLQFDSYPGFCWLMNTQQPSLHLGQPLGTSWMMSFKMRFSISDEDSLRCRVLVWYLIPLLGLRPHASRSKLSSSLIVPTVQPSNTATNASRWKKHMQLLL